MKNELNIGSHSGTLALVFIMLASQGYALPGSNPDSVLTKKEEPRWHIRSTARIHSKGMFAFGGRISSENPAVDLNFIYERKQWGLLLFKAADMKDHTSPFNFALAALYKNIRISKRLTITPNLGTFLEQSHSIADYGSDVATIIITSYKISPVLIADHTALVGNLVIDPKERDWVNRFRLMYSNKHLDVTYWLWHNNHVFDHTDYISSGITVGYSRVKVSKHMNLSASITELSMLRSSDTQSVPTGNKVLVSLAVQFAR